MLSDFIGGGQVFLHKVRMFMQVMYRTIHLSLLMGILVGGLINWSSLKQIEWDEFVSYRKAKTAIVWDEAMNMMRSSIGKEDLHISYINAKFKGKVFLNIDPNKLIKMSMFKQADARSIIALQNVIMHTGCVLLISFVLIFILWNRFGAGLKSEKKISGTGVVLTKKQVKDRLIRLGKASDYVVGNMPLVKDMEMRHFLVTGSTGSGKTNLIHDLLQQVQKKMQPAIVIDQTGEMIAKYYNQSRGDIIFNPFDDRGSNWDFWQDCSDEIELERFSKILIGFNRKSSSSNGDPFWENAAMSVFNCCIEFLRAQKSGDTSNASMKEIVDLVCNSNIGYLKTILQNTEAGRYLGKDSKQTAESIISVLTASVKPLKFLVNADQDEENKQQNMFSIKQYFEKLKGGDDAWLFLATKPSNRSLTLPLIACMSELALLQLMDIGIDKQRRVWVVMDELASLGKLPSLSPLMSEGRKYGACVVAGMQSLNQVYEHYGQYSGSTIFGQFGTNFFFRNNEPAIAKMVRDMCGSETVTRQQKNTSFGANEHRDGVSYNEQEQKKFLVEIDDLAALAVGECYTILPLPDVRLSKMQLDEIHVTDQCAGFIQKRKANEINKINLREEVNDELIVAEEKEEGDDENITEDIVSTGSVGASKKPSHLEALVRVEPLIEDIEITDEKDQKDKEDIEEITIK